ncbi:XrtA-associated tyrosine autokinase [Chitinimonas sp.]|uniref:XrtA-associated tyrosine autokinase n=1 Tax=Chitinimonas sp. TaxID=1934313 RepID=UPI002F9405A3
MSLIEQAAKRLAELREAGVDVPEATSDQPSAEPSLLERAAAVIPEHETVVRPTPRQTPVAEAPVATTPMAPAPVTTPVPATTAPLLKSRTVNLDLATIAAAGIIRPDAPRSQLADEFRVVKRPLIANALGKGAAPIKYGNLIMVTSALPGEGKSFTAVNLAMSIAMELDTTVMLVDADVARPSVLKMLGLPAAPGLLDVLVDESMDLSKVLLRTNVETLTILPSGTQHARATELLASDGMMHLLEDMANRYPDRIIIFDSPPLLVTTEARVLATHMGQVVMVVRAESTAQSDVKHALAAIESCPVKLMLLNQARVAAQGAYGYGYGYGYGH